MLKGINSTFSAALKCRHIRLLSGKIAFAYIPQEQKALIALQTMHFIMKAEVKNFSEDNRSLRTRIFEMEHLTNNFLNNIRRVKEINKSSFDPNISSEGDSTQAYKALYQVGFQKQNIDQVLCAYNLGQGIYYDSSVWTQDRFNKIGVSPNTKMVLMPNIGTGKIFGKILNQVGTYIIAGEKGSGKSYAYLNYIHLAKFIIDYRIYLFQNKRSPSKQFDFLADKDLFMKVRKLFYFPLKYIDSKGNLENIILQQTGFKNKDEIKLVSGIRTQKQLPLTILQLYYQSMNIKTACVVDESNVYFSFLRSHIGKAFSTGQQAALYSDLLDHMRFRFGLVIYNSSQTAEALQIKKWTASKRKPDGNKSHDPFQHQIRVSTNFKFSYSQLLGSKQGHTHLYSIFWDELCKQMQSYNLQRQSNIKNIFEKTFGLPSSLKMENQELYDQINMQNKFIWWSNDVRHLEIITILKISSDKQQHLQPLQKALSQPWTKESVNRISEAFTKLKQLIEEEREQNFLISVNNYLTKQLNINVKSFRFALLSKLKSVRSQLPFDQHKLQEIETDFAQELKTFSKKKKSINYRKQIDDFSELLGFGYRTIQKKSENSIKHRFLLTLKSASQLTTSIFEDLDQIIQIAQYLISKGSLTQKIGGNLYDVLYYHLFQNSSFSFSLKSTTQRQNDKKEIEPISLPKVFNIVETFGFQVRVRKEKMDLSEQLKQLIEFVKEKKNQQALGYPITKFPEKQFNQELIKDYIYNDQNPIFDFIIMKNVGNQLIVHSIDNTVGQINEKISRYVSKKYHDQLIFQIQRISKLTGLQVIWHYSLLAPQFKVVSFNQINHKQEFQLNFAQGREYKKGNVTLQYGIFCPNKEHFVLPESKKIIQSSIKVAINDIFEYLKLTEKLKSKNILLSNQEILEYNRITEGPQK